MTTKEEALEIIKKAPLYDNTTWTYAKELHEAINVLEQEPCEDAISRQMVKDKYRESLIHNLTDNNRGIDLSKYAEKPYEVFCKFINSIPPVKLQEPCEDAISREAILLEIDKIKDNYGGLLDIAMFIRGLPSVNPQPKTGHWIMISSTDMYCSECNEIEYLDTSRKFCAYCGARMIDS